MIVPLSTNLMALYERHTTRKRVSAPTNKQRVIFFFFSLLLSNSPFQVWRIYANTRTYRHIPCSIDAACLLSVCVCVCVSSDCSRTSVLHSICTFRRCVDRETALTFIPGTLEHGKVHARRGCTHARAGSLFRADKKKEKEGQCTTPQSTRSTFSKTAVPTMPPITPS